MPETRIHRGWQTLGHLVTEDDVDVVAVRADQAHPTLDLLPRSSARPASRWSRISSMAQAALVRAAGAGPRRPVTQIGRPRMRCDRGVRGDDMWAQCLENVDAGRGDLGAEIGELTVPYVEREITDAASLPPRRMTAPAVLSSAVR